MIKRGGGIRALAALGVIGVLVAGCADRDGADAPDGAGSGLAARLASLPESVVGDGDHPVQVAIADLDRAVELAGISRPADPTDPDEVREFLNALSGYSADGPPVSTMFPEAAQYQRVDQVAEFAAELGWSAADVSWFAEYQVPPDTFTAVGGVEQFRVADALGERPDDGIWRVGGEDYEVDVQERTAARPLGQALRLALADDHLVISRSTPPVAAALTGGPTLADDPTLSALAAALDSEDAYSALILSGQPGTFEDQLPTPQARAQAEADGVAALPHMFTGVAVGSTQIDGTPYGVFAYVHETEADAAANADAVRTLVTEGASMITGAPWSERFELADIRIDGTTVIARLALGDGPPLLPYNMLLRQDNLTSHVAADGR